MPTDAALYLDASVRRVSASYLVRSRSLALVTAILISQARYSVKTRDFIPSISVEEFHFITLENKAIGLVSLLNSQLFEIHHRCANALAWLEVFEYMKRNPTTLHRPDSGKFTTPVIQTVTLANKSSWNLWYLQVISRAFRYGLGQTPVFFRAFAYKRLAGSQISSTVTLAQTGLIDFLLFCYLILWFFVSPNGWHPRENNWVSDLYLDRWPIAFSCTGFKDIHSWAAANS